MAINPWDNDWKLGMQQWKNLQSKFSGYLGDCAANGIPESDKNAKPLWMLYETDDMPGQINKRKNPKTPKSYITVEDKAYLAKMHILWDEHETL